MSLNKLLQWSLSQQSDGNTAGVQGGVIAPARTEEEKQWLASALASMSVDEAARMRDLGKALQSTDSVDASSFTPSELSSGAALAQLPAVAAAEASLAALKLQALEELQDLVESLDNAKDLFMVGAVGPLLDAVRGVPPVAVAAPEGAPAGSPSAVRVHGTTALTVRAQACLVVATVVQNNPAAQAWAMGADTLPALLTALATPGGAALPLRASAAGAVSALLRDCPRAQEALLCTGGAGVLAGGVGALAACLGGAVGTQGEVEAACANVAQRRLWRRTTALLRHLTAQGCFPEHALTGLALASTAIGEGEEGGGARGSAQPEGLGRGEEGKQEEGTQGGSAGACRRRSAPLSALQALLALLELHPRAEAGGAAEPPEFSDIRCSVLACLQTLAQPAVPVKGIEEIQDTRAPRGLYDGQQRSGGGGSGGASEAGGTAASHPPPPAAPSAAAATTTTPLPSGPMRLLTLAERRTAMLSLKAVGAVQQHLQWCSSQGRGAASGLGGGGASSAVEEEEEEDVYAVEAELCRAVLAAFGAV